MLSSELQSDFRYHDPLRRYHCTNNPFLVILLIMFGLLHVRMCCAGESMRAFHKADGLKVLYSTALEICDGLLLNHLIINYSC